MDYHSVSVLEIINVTSHNTQVREWQPRTQNTISVDSPLTHFDSDLGAENLLGLTESILNLCITLATAILLRSLSRAQGIPWKRFPVVPRNVPVKSRLIHCEGRGGAGGIEWGLANFIETKENQRVRLRSRESKGKRQKCTFFVTEKKATVHICITVY